MTRNLLIIVCLLLTTIHITAQENPEQPAPQFLYRDENRLILVDGYTGETTELPFEVSDADRFSWSPDGQYLLAELREEDAYTACLNLYDVDTLEWVYDEPISCDVEQTVFFSDGERIAYETFDGTRSKLWLFNIVEVTNQELYRAREISNTAEIHIEYLQLSPTEAYLTFVEADDIVLGGSWNKFFVMNVMEQRYFTVSAGDLYYASYRPIWSPDDTWFLITLQDEYITGGAIAVTNHQGDVYLVNTQTERRYRLTYTPTVLETNLRWMEDGSIAFTIPQEQTLTIEEAINIEPPNPDSIIIPEPIDPEEFFASRLAIMISPDPMVGSWVNNDWTEENEQIFILNLGEVMPERGNVIFTAQVSEYYYRSSSILIGWRPSNYPYDRGIG